MSHSYVMEPDSLRPESAPLTPVSAQTPLPAPSPAGTAAVPLHPQPAPRIRSTKPHVPSACINCKKAHLACDCKCTHPSKQLHSPLRKKKLSSQSPYTAYPTLPSDLPEKEPIASLSPIAVRSIPPTPPSPSTPPSTPSILVDYNAIGSLVLLLAHSPKNSPPRSPTTFLSYGSLHSFFLRVSMCMDACRTDGRTDKHT
ncbi:hypothetical protein B0O80DRAFT_179503 [Mortierella sp. GBAus27b]|nr:hypothetical protein B0O80DRAFT_179503 [Mortierella sp. GBAus27b]